MTFIARPSSIHFKTMGSGKGRRDGGVWLGPEEALYLLERGTLDLRWGKAGQVGRDGIGNAEGRQEEEGKEEEGMVGLPVSLQAGFAFLIGVQGLTLERYTVYVSLKRAGFIVKRAPTWDNQGTHIDDDNDAEARCTNPLTTVVENDRSTSSSSSSNSIWQSMWNAVFEKRRRRAREDALRHGPLVGKGLYRNYSTPSSLSKNLTFFSNSTFSHSAINSR